MNGFLIVRPVVVLATFVLLCTALPAQETTSTAATHQPKCAEIHAIAGMARARSTTALTAWKSKASDSYRAKVVFAFRLFELRPRDQQAASALFELIPKNDEQDWVWYSFSGYLDCVPKSAKSDTERETEKEVVTLARLEVRFTNDLARAVLIVPSKMLAYVSYANASVAYPDSDYAVQMQRVCRARHLEFVKAVDQLSPDDKKWFLANTFDPNGCRVLHFPEQ